MTNSLKNKQIKREEREGRLKVIK